MKNIRLFYLFLGICILLLNACAKKCPADINIGSINLSSSTMAFLPKAQRVEKLIFKNNKGDELVFNNQNPEWSNRTPLDVEVLCERGDFLDKTVQTVFYDTESYHLYYKTKDEKYSISIDLQLNNDNFTGDRKDTVFYETFAVSSYGTGPKSDNGVVSILPNLRGNGTKISQERKDASNINRFVSDTTFDNHTLKNIWITPEGNQRNIFIFYSKIQGIEAIILNGEIWWRA
jgi:hypothetical protein